MDTQGRYGHRISQSIDIKGEKVTVQLEVLLLPSQVIAYSGTSATSGYLVWDVLRYAFQKKGERTLRNSRGPLHSKSYPIHYSYHIRLQNIEKLLN